MDFDACDYSDPRERDAKSIYGSRWGAVRDRGEDERERHEREPRDPDPREVCAQRGPASRIGTRPGPGWGETIGAERRHARDHRGLSGGLGQRA